MRKLLGYRLKEDFRNDKRIIKAACTIDGYENFGESISDGQVIYNDTYKLKQAGVMHWFEEVYEEEKFKVGDIVAWEGINFKVGKIQRKCDRFSDSWYLDERHNSCSEINLRHATEEEKRRYYSLNGKTAIIDGVEYELKIKN